MKATPGVTSMRQFAGDLWRHDRRRCGASFGLIVFGALTESLGLLLIVPLVVAAGVADGGSSSISDTVRSVLDAVGVPFTLGWMLIIYVAIIALRAGVDLIQRMVMARLRLEFTDALRLRLFDAVARARWQFHLTRRTTDISHAITEDVRRVNQGATMFLDASGRLVASLAYLAVALRLSLSVTAIGLGLMLLLTALAIPTIGLSRRAGIHQTIKGRHSFETQHEFMSALKLAKSHGNEDRHVEAYTTDVGAVRDSMMDYERITGRTDLVLQIGIAGALAAMTWFAVEIADTPHAELLALIVVVARLAPVGAETLSRLQWAANMMPAYQSAIEMIDDAESDAEDVTESPVSGRALTDSIELRGVGFSYAEGAIRAIDGIDLVIPARSTTALVGSSGAGKTTLADLVLGLMDPSDGEITIDGVPLSEIGLRAWRQQVAYVPQDTFLFHDTLRANIAWAAPHPLSDADIDELVESAALSAVVDRLPDGVNTLVGDRGQSLSGGERQRVALARALARRPALLVLDEATSALDTEHERAVHEAIDRLTGQVTLLVIAHRLSTVRSADQIVVIEAGRVVQRGTWDELMASPGRFTELASADA